MIASESVWPRNVPRFHLRPIEVHRDGIVKGRVRPCGRWQAVETSSWTRNSKCWSSINRSRSLVGATTEACPVNKPFPPVWFWCQCVLKTNLVRRTVSTPKAASNSAANVSAMSSTITMPSGPPQTIVLLDRSLGISTTVALSRRSTSMRGVELCAANAFDGTVVGETAKTEGEAMTLGGVPSW